MNRLRDLALWPTAGAVALFTVLAIALAWGALHESRARGQLARRNCEAIEHIKSFAYQSAQRSLTTLPTLAYYKQHPDELQFQLEMVREQLRFFAPRPCP